MKKILIFNCSRLLVFLKKQCYNKSKINLIFYGEKHLIMYEYVRDFEKLGLGLFVHFGLYSVLGKGEWALNINHIPKEKYKKLADRFNPSKNWAKNLAKTAKKAGAKYITLTTRHHDGYSLFNTKGLSTYDAVNTAPKRDLIREFVDACNEEEIIPFFYHTLMDWDREEYKTDFNKYLDYLIASVELLCKNYGKVGGFWFDGMWDKKDADWQEDRLYGVIRKYQPEAMIINNTGLSELGKLGHRELDSVTFERGKPRMIEKKARYVASEMCQVLNDHWGYAKYDCNYKSVAEIINNFIDCRKCDCNFLINTGLKGNGEINTIDKGILLELGKWVKKNKYVYTCRSCQIQADNADVLFDGEYYYAVIKNVAMKGDENVQLSSKTQAVKIYADIKDAKWYDCGKKVEIKDGVIKPLKYRYGESYCTRTVRFTVK